MHHKTLVLLFLTLSFAGAVKAENAEIRHLRLVDRLDRPMDGYCLDILGTRKTLRLEVPVFAHNCKPVLTTDSALRQTDTGGIEFVSVGLCITAAGVNGTILPGSAIILKGCGQNVPFFETAGLQQFTHQSNGQLELGKTGLCLAVGAESSRTYSPHDRWRVLSVEECSKVELKFSNWEFVIPPRR